MPISKTLRNVFLVLLALWIVHRPLVEILVDWLWFDALGYLDVFQTRLYARLGLWVVGFSLAAGFVALNIRYAFKQQPLDYERISVMMAELEIPPFRIRNIVRLLLGLWIVLPALFFGGVVQANWMEVLAWQNQVPFGVKDSVWGFDIGFYVFELPVWRLMHGLSIALVIVSILPVVLLYVGRDVFVLRAVPELKDGAKNHVLLLIGSLFVLFGVGWWLDRFDLLTSHSGVVWGVSYTDLNARVPGYWAMMAAAFVVAALFFASLRRQSWRAPAMGVVGYFVFRILISNVWPVLVQDYIVKPNEFERERDFIIQNIEHTRAAYGLGDIAVRDFPASGELTREDIAANPETINNLRIWDTRPLLTTYGQLQEIRPYYEMVGVDVDRYEINGEPRQVMLSARELDYANLPGTAKSWVNEHIFYTHGYGLTMSPVNEVSGKGLPGLFLQSIPPEVSSTPKTQLDEASTALLTVDQPGIYYGELSNDYVLVKTSEKELDYADEGETVYTNYDGVGGVGIGDLARKLLFSMHFKDVDILLSQYLKSDTRILFRRQIVDRIRTLVPFLQLDGDPYVVISEGKMVFMADAYTTSDAYPYAEPIQIEGRSSFNYIRNSVKIVLDAYDGSVDLYMSDDSDPLIQVYSKIFPTLFRPLDEMPDDLKKHIRYPADFFDIQASMYRTYHMNDPLVFYNMEDMWEVPRELYAGQEQPVESYYLIMKLPPDPDSTEEEEAKFILLLPFNPVGKPNMTAWMAAECDYGEDYGDLVLYQFNRGDFYNGPRQIEAQIDQDVEISEQITLWNQSGSRVVRGNLLVIPIEESLIYVEPLYLQAEQSQMPELKQVIVFYGDPQHPEEAQVVMRRTLDEALDELFNRIDKAKGILELSIEQNSQPVLDSVPALTPLDETAPLKISAIDGTWQGNAQEAHGLFIQATEAQRAGDWAAYGEALKALEARLMDLDAASRLAANNSTNEAEESEPSPEEPEPEAELTPEEAAVEPQ